MPTSSPERGSDIWLRTWAVPARAGDAAAAHAAHRAKKSGPRRLTPRSCQVRGSLTRPCGQGAPCARFELREGAQIGDVSITLPARVAPGGEIRPLLAALQRIEVGHVLVQDA